MGQFSGFHLVGQDLKIMVITLIKDPNLIDLPVIGDDVSVKRDDQSVKGSGSSVKGS